MNIDSNDFDFIIKTHEREYSLSLLLKSIREFYPSSHIIIADDSKKPYKSRILKTFHDLSIDYIVTENLGINHGRNLAAKRATSKYVVLLDDDYIITNQSDIINSIGIMRRYGAEIICGITDEYLDFSPVRILGTIKHLLMLDFARLIRHIFSIGKLGATLKLKYDNNNKYFSKHDLEQLDNIVEIEYGPNFFIIETETLKRIDYWNDKDYPPIDHSGFFERLNNNEIKILLNKNLIIKHVSRRSIYYFFLRRKKY